MRWRTVVRPYGGPGYPEGHALADGGQAALRAAGYPGATYQRAPIKQGTPAGVPRARAHG